MSETIIIEKQGILTEISIKTLTNKTMDYLKKENPHLLISDIRLAEDVIYTLFKELLK